MNSRHTVGSVSVQVRSLEKAKIASALASSIVCLLAVGTYGATYFVDNSPDVTGGNHPSYGSESHPWRSISYAISRIKGGDVLFVKSGLYHESGLYLTSRLSGTSSRSTWILACPGDKVTIQGNGVDSGRVKIVGCTDLAFDGFTVSNLNQGIYIESSANIMVEHCTVRDIGQEGIHVNGNSQFVTIQNCAIFDTGQWKYNGEGVYVGTGSHGPVDNTAHVVVRSNLVYNTGQDSEAIELKAGTHDCVVEHNIIHDIHTGPDFGAVEVNAAALGVQRWDADPDQLVRDNVLHNTETAIRLGTGCLAYNNLIYNVTNGCYGILLDNNAHDAYPRRVYDNTIVAPAANAVFIQPGQSVVSDIRDNIGPAQTNNLPAKASYFIDPSAGDFHLVQGSAPIGAGVNLSAIVSADLDGNPRPVGAASDLGAYQYVELPPGPPTDLRVLQ